jgi:hypothetical protein
MTLGHLVFGAHFFLMMFSQKTHEAGATRFGFLRMSRSTVPEVPM